MPDPRPTRRVHIIPALTDEQRDAEIARLEAADGLNVPDDDACAHYSPQIRPS